MATSLGQNNTPSFLGLHPTDQPQTFRIIFPTPKGIAQCAYLANPSSIAFLIASNISDIKKIHTSIIAAVRHLFFSCGGPTNLLPRPHVWISIKYKTAALERSKLNQKKVRYHVF
jgi:uncharacterized Zn-finger protein